LLFIGSQEAVKTIWSKIWIFHRSTVVERGKYSLLKVAFSLKNLGKCPKKTVNSSEKGSKSIRIEGFLEQFQ
jgi:primosomal replication protein N